MPLFSNRQLREVFAPATDMSLNHTGGGAKGRVDRGGGGSQGGGGVSVLLSRIVFGRLRFSFGVIFRKLESIATLNKS